MTPQERLDYLLETEYVPTNALVTIGTIRDSVGLTPQEYGLVRSTLDTVIATLKASSNPIERVQGLDLQDALSAMLAGGISLSGVDRQLTIDRLAQYGQWPNSVRDAIKSLGGVTRPRWVSEGYGSEPTLEQIEAELEPNTQEPDEIKHEVLLSVNRGTDGEIRVMARITPVEFAEGVELRRGEVQTLVNDAALVAALSPIIQGLIDA